MEADTGRPLPDPDLRSPDPSVCPFLRAENKGRIEAPSESPDDGNRCTSGEQPEAIQLEWQQSTCLTGAHVRCGRYLLGAAGGPMDTVAGQSPDPSASPDIGGRPPRGGLVLSPAIAVSLVFLVASAAAAVTFVTATGGIKLAGALPTATATATTEHQEPTPAPTATPVPEPSFTPTPAPTFSPAPTPTSAPTIGPLPTPAPTSDRYAVLKPCPSTPDCYLYTVAPGNNLRSIANYFGVAYATVLELNPQIVDPSTIQPGDVIVLPPPTK